MGNPFELASFGVRARIIGAAGGGGSSIGLAVCGGRTCFNRGIMIPDKPSIIFALRRAEQEQHQHDQQHPA